MRKSNNRVLTGVRVLVRVFIAYCVIERRVPLVAAYFSSTDERFLQAWLFSDDQDAVGRQISHARRESNSEP